MKKIKVDRFVALLIMMILLAYWWPGLEKVIPLDQISKIGISGIFFFYGLKLSPEKMKEGISNWRLHLVIQLATFLLFPILLLIVFPFIQGEAYFTLWLAVFFFGRLAIYGFFICGNGLNCQGKYSGSNFQCQHFWPDRYSDHAALDWLVLGSA